MAFDPTKPANNAPDSSAEMRGQLQGLKALSDAILRITAAQIDGVTTLNPGDNASIQATFDGSSVRFVFGIPRGQDGPPGEVTNAQLASPISGTSSNINAVSTLDTPFVNDPPTLAEMELMRAKFNELVQALRR